MLFSLPSESELDPFWFRYSSLGEVNERIKTVEQALPLLKGQTLALVNLRQALYWFFFIMAFFLCSTFYALFKSVVELHADHTRRE